MKFFAIIFCLLFFISCGYTSRNNETVGQVKKVEQETPIICPDMINVDMSLGVMRNGVGSMSTEDKWFYLPENKIEYLKILKEAQENGKLVKIIFDNKRFVICAHSSIIVSVKFMK